MDTLKGWKGVVTKFTSAPLGRLLDGYSWTVKFADLLDPNDVAPLLYFDQDQQAGTNLHDVKEVLFFAPFLVTMPLIVLLYRAMFQS